MNFRLDVTFEVDGKQVTGSGVQKLEVRRTIPIIGAKQASWNVSGEAIAVDLPRRRTVFVLLAQPTVDGHFTYSVQGRYDFLVVEACGLAEKRDNLSWAAFVRLVGRVSGTCEIQFKDLPVMVFFEDENDPSTVQRVHPDNMKTPFGHEVRFVSASLTIVDDPVSSGLGKRLSWLSSYPEPGLGDRSKRINNKFLAALRHGHFRKVAK